jgi:hypothetical protein
VGVQVGRVYRLVFPDGHESMPGVVARIKGLSIRQFLDVQRLASIAEQRGKGGQADTAAVLEAVVQLATITGERLLEWNVDDEEDRPVPANAEGVLDLDPEAFTALVEEWLDAVAGVPGPLAGTSSGGPSPEELSMPMEPLSASLAS